MTIGQVLERLLEGQALILRLHHGAHEFAGRLRRVPDARTKARHRLAAAAPGVAAARLPADAKQFKPVAGVAPASTHGAMLLARRRVARIERSEIRASLLRGGRRWRGQHRLALLLRGRRIGRVVALRRIGTFRANLAADLLQFLGGETAPGFRRVNAEADRVSVCERAV
ncbi:MAG: hypothetical protein WEA28_12970 [Xanthobacteraceae bacterium]